MSTETFWQGIEQFNQQEFYACHDTLEDLWLESVEPEKTFYQAILQIAVGCYHLGNNNWRGAVILLGEGIKKLRDYEPTYGGIDVTSLTESSIELLEDLHKNPEQLASFPQKLPKITRENQNHLNLSPMFHGRLPS